MTKYLFAHFIGEQRDGEQVYFAISEDGLNWTDLNKGEPLLYSKMGEKGVRDPFVVKDEELGKYYLIATDLRIEAGKGWHVAQYEGSRSLMVWESTNLIEWAGPRKCDVGIDGAGCVWAPEAVYDKERKAFFVFWASMVKLEGDENAKQRIYGSFTKDFQEFSEPFVYIEKANHVIDTTIVQDNGTYYRFSKDEVTKRIIMEKSDDLLGEFQPVYVELLENLPGVEGPEIYRLPDGRWCLIVDRFAEGKGYLPLIATDLAKADFIIPSDGDYHFGITKKRHGGVISITEEEYKNLLTLL